VRQRRPATPHRPDSARAPYIHHVSAQSGKHIDDAMADAFIAAAQQIIDAVG
jgi:hypothetical protein